MPRTLFLISTLLSMSFWSAGQGIPPVGQWREHLPFNNALAVSADGSTTWCATPYGFFTYTISSGAFARKTRVNGLSEVRVSCMARDAQSGRIALGYANSNLDILDGDQVSNVPDILLSTVTGDKRLNAALWSEGKLLLATGLGIIVVNADRSEISDTWRIGNGGASTPVTSLVISKGYLYAAGTDGLKRGTYPNGNLADPAAWETITGGDLSAGAVARIIVHNGDLYVLKQDSLFQGHDGQWTFAYAPGVPVTGLDDGPDGPVLSTSDGTHGKIIILDGQGQVSSTLATASMSKPAQAVFSDGVWWVADLNNGLLSIEGGTEQRVFPNSPISTADGALYADRSAVWVTAGSVNDSWNYQYNPNGFFRFDGSQWFNTNLYTTPALDTALDLITVAPDYAAGKTYFGSYGGGLVELTGAGSFHIYKQGTGLQPATGDPSSYRVSGLAVDADGELWMANYGAPQDLVMKTPDGNWYRFSIPFPHTENAVADMQFDDAGHLWIVSPKGNGLFCYDPGADHTSSSDDRWRYYRQGVGNGNLPSSDVRCVARDRDGFIWVGTGDGIGVITCLDAVFTNNSCEAFLPVVVQGGIGSYLFKGEEVRTIAVDGANRKWVGTRNGAWLISADGEQTIEHFTEANSPLLNNDVNHIAIDPASGEVFFSTFNGICSYRGGATVADSSIGKVLVFPNPVPHGYSGNIAIRGLPENAWVRITELDGRLVYQARALGGQAVWNGMNYKGQKPSSSAYLVLASDTNNQGKVVAKIFFIR